VFCLVTGGAGFIGSHVCEALIARGDRVRILDNFATGKRDTAQRLQRSGIEFVEGDIRSYHIVRDAVRDVEVIIHLAALPSVPRSIKDPITTNEVNVGGTLNVLDAAREGGVARVVFASSSSVYGSNAQLPKSEDMMPQPISPYAVSKLAGEKYCQAFTRSYGLETVSLRYFNVFGPRQDPQSAYAAFIPKCLLALRSGTSFTIDGDGSHSRDFTYVSNVVQANLRALDAENIGGEVFNIACGDSLSVKEAVQHLQKLTGCMGDVLHGPERVGDVPHSLADIEHAKQLLGYRPEVSSIEGLNRLIQEF
jgi:nucleoside-diphosphate-sugar epimerase